MSPRQAADAARFERRIRRDDVVLTYDPESELGFTYRPRRPEDGCMVLDWPRDVPLPTGEKRAALDLPPEGT
ncbi:hypothetical protein [Streptomyces sp. PT12]|uniref:hypothetical protein n=1 Tax=Streptomyces sp. PT12 TaxID=1510197 RepID=UPI0015EF137C|nr:hypothetical protein [Streptomyces sp. PT12]